MTDLPRPPTGPPPGSPVEPPPTVCYRHPDRRAGVRCQRCERPICPSCMTQASVGFQCPECVGEAAGQAPVYTARTLPGFTPVVTLGFIALNVLVFVVQIVTLRAGGDLLMGMSSGATESGALWGPAVGAGEWWRLVTSGFLHVGLLHVGMNMFVLYLLGPSLERLFGPVRFAAVYVASLLAGSLGVMLLSPTAVTVGASGAIFGLMGAAAAVQLANRVSLWQSGLGTVILINLVITFSFSGRISIGGHLGGLIGGAAVGYGVLRLAQRRLPPVVGTLVAAGAALLFAVLAVVAAPTATFVVR